MSKGQNGQLNLKSSNWWAVHVHHVKKDAKSFFKKKCQLVNSLHHHNHWRIRKIIARKSTKIRMSVVKKIVLFYSLQRKSFNTKHIKKTKTFTIHLGSIFHIRWFSGLVKTFPSIASDRRNYLTSIGFVWMWLTLMRIVYFSADLWSYSSNFVALYWVPNRFHSAKNHFKKRSFNVHLIQLIMDIFFLKSCRRRY